MPSQTIAGYFALTLFFTSIVFFVESHHFADPSLARNPISYQTVHANREDDVAHLFLYYPLGKSAGTFTVYLNRKNIGKIISGGRMECRLLDEGPVAVTILEGAQYKEPLTQSSNSRTVTVKKGKSYYFRVNGTGELEYTFNNLKGEKSFAEIKDFLDRPAALTELAEGSVPPLSTTHN